MAGHRALLLVAVVLLAVTAIALAEESKPSILTPVADTPLGSFEGDEPAADDAMEDAGDAAPVGAPIGTTMTEPMPELTTTTAAGDAGEEAIASGASPLGVAAHIGAIAAVAAGVFAF